MRSFRKFVEEKESPYISSLEDELGINSDDLEKEPQIASFFSFGKNITNIGPYKIVKFKRNEKGKITHAVVSQIGDESIKNRQYKDKEGTISRVKNDNENNRFLVPIEDLDKLLSQDFSATQAGVV